MRRPYRFRVRTLMAIVAVVALGFGVAFELENHAERDRFLRVLSDRRREAMTHFMRAMECTLAMERSDPYHPAARATELRGDRVRTFLPPGGFRSWEGELEDHRYWGMRSHDETVGCDERLEAIEARLLIHTPGSR